MHMIAICYAANILITVQHTDTVCVVQSTGTVLPQAGPMML